MRPGSGPQIRLPFAQAATQRIHSDACSEQQRRVTGVEPVGSECLVTVIEEDADLVTLIVVFTVKPEDQAGHVDMLRVVAAEHSKTDGFISCSILASEDGTRVTEYIQWKSHAHLQVMLGSKAGAAHVNDESFISEVHSYRVASVTQHAVTTGGSASL